MDRKLLDMVGKWLRQTSNEQGIADVFLIAMFVFIMAVLLSGHRIVVQ
jgi:hypothetical protein